MESTATLKEPARKRAMKPGRVELELVRPKKFKNKEIPDAAMNTHKKLLEQSSKSLEETLRVVKHRNAKLEATITAYTSILFQDMDVPEKHEDILAYAAHLRLCHDGANNNRGSDNSGSFLQQPESPTKSPALSICAGLDQVPKNETLTTASSVESGSSKSSKMTWNYPDEPVSEGSGEMPPLPQASGIVPESGTDVPVTPGDSIARAMHENQVGTRASATLVPVPKAVMDPNSTPASGSAAGNFSPAPTLVPEIQNGAWNEFSWEILRRLPPSYYIDFHVTHSKPLGFKERQSVRDFLQTLAGDKTHSIREESRVTFRVVYLRGDIAFDVHDNIFLGGNYIRLSLFPKRPDIIIKGSAVVHYTQNRFEKNERKRVRKEARKAEAKQGASNKTPDPKN